VRFGDADLVEALLDRCGQRGLFEAGVGGDRDVGVAGCLADLVLAHLRSSQQWGGQRVGARW